MLAGLDGFAWIRLVVWLGIGLVIYLAYGIHKSKVRGLSVNRREKEINSSMIFKLLSLKISPQHITSISTFLNVVKGRIFKYVVCGMH